MERKSCDDFIETVTIDDLEYARSLCNGKEYCRGVYDPGCDGKAPLHLCHKRAPLQESSSSCFYYNGTYFRNIITVFYCRKFSQSNK